MASALQGRLTQPDAVRLLLRRGADPSTKNLEHEQPVQLVPDGPLGDQVREPRVEQTVDDGEDNTASYYYLCIIHIFEKNR